MAWLLMLGMALTGSGILIALYLPLLAAQFVGPDKIRLYALIGAVVVVIGTAVEILSVWPVPDIDTEQSAED
jgi:NADH:ubiquinone oxidoreductase subunit 6 (subunit J)